MPSSTVTHMNAMHLARWFAISAWCAIVSVTPEVSSSAVLIVGIGHGPIVVNGSTVPPGAPVAPTPELGQIALKYGANDLGSIMIEENVVSAAGTTHRMGVADMKRLITDLGYEPRQRDNWYRLVGNP